MTTAQDHVSISAVITQNRAAAGKLADAELHFHGGTLSGFKLVGFAVWERADGTRNVTFPASRYLTRAGESRSYTMLRPILDDTDRGPVVNLILAAFAEQIDRAA
jgi:hypothetical protein